MSFGDIDNDGKAELIVCNQEGNVTVFKDGRTEPHLSARGAGMISCHAAGDIMNIDEVSLIVVSWNGSSTIFHVNQHGGKSQLDPVLKCKLPVNIRSCLIDETYRDNHSRVVVLSIDNVVSSYKWETPMNGDHLKGAFVCMNRWETISAINSISVDVCGGDNGYIFSTIGGVLYNIYPYEYEEDGSKIIIQEGRHHEKNYFELTEQKKRLDPECETFVCGSVEVLRNRNSCRYVPKESLNNQYCQAVASANGSVVLVKDGRVLWRVNLKQPIMHLSEIIVPDHSMESRSVEQRDGVEISKLEGAFLRSRGFSGGSDSVATSFDSEGVASCTPEDEFTLKKDFHLGRKTSLPLCALDEYLNGFDASSVTQNERFRGELPKNPNLISNLEKYKTPCKSYIVAASQNGDTFYFDVDDGFYYKQSVGRQVSTCASGSFHVQGERRTAIAYAVLGGVILMTDVHESFVKSNALEKHLFGNDVYTDALRALGVDASDPEQVRLLNEYLLYDYVPQTDKTK